MPFKLTRQKLPEFQEARLKKQQNRKDESASFALCEICTGFLSSIGAQHISFAKKVFTALLALLFA